MQCILADTAVSVSKLKKSPSAVLRAANGSPVAILSRNRIAGYMVPVAVLEAMVERLDDLELAQLAKVRLDAGEPRVHAQIVGDDIVFEGDAA